MGILNSIKTSEILTGKEKKVLNVAINGFGRIGRAFLRQAIESDTINVIAVNDLGDINNMVYLLSYDTVYKSPNFEVEAKILNDTEKYLIVKNAFKYDKNGNKLLIADKQIKFIQEKELVNLPWKSLNIDVVVESTGLYTTWDKAKGHVDSGAKHVVISAPAKDGVDENINGETVLMGVNEATLNTCSITSNASCTTNAASPLIAILDAEIGIHKAMLSTVHAYTASQSIVDGPNKKDWREGRAGASNIVPSSTGAAIAVTKVFKPLVGKFDGISMRVPVPAGSIVDITFLAKRNTNAEEVNEILRKASKLPNWEGIFLASDDELVSSDIQGSRYACIADLKMTRVVDGDLVKVLGWYDNEAGYTSTLIKHVEAVVL